MARFGPGSCYVPATNVDQPLEIIREACARNASVELHFYGHAGVFCRVRVRLLDVGADGSLLLDRPEQAGQTIPIPYRQKLTGFFLLQGRRYQFVTRLNNARVLVPINERQRVPGIALDPPQQLEEQQRRRDYRVTIPLSEVVLVELVGMDPAVPDACPIGARRYEARLLDISAGGMSLLGERRAFRTLAAESFCYATLRLPASERTLNLLLEVRHAVDLWELRQRRIGCAIVAWRGSNPNADTRAILRYATFEQRRQLAQRRT